MIKNFFIMKAKEGKSDKAPTHRISAKIGDEFVEIGGCWTKDAKDGSKFLSCQLQKAWVDHSDRTKCRVGFAIANEKDIMEDTDDNTPVDEQNGSVDAF